MNVQALKRLEQFVKTLNPATVNERVGWTNKDGSVASMIGHACRDPWFNKQGLTITDDWPYNTQPAFKEFRGTQALEKFFHLNTVQANQIFLPASYVSGVGEEAIGQAVLNINKVLIIKKETK